MMKGFMLILLIQFYFDARLLSVKIKCYLYKRAFHIYDTIFYPILADIRRRFNVYHRRHKDVL